MLLGAVVCGTVVVQGVVLVTGWSSGPKGRLAAAVVLAACSLLCAAGVVVAHVVGDFGGMPICARPVGAVLLGVSLLMSILAMLWWPEAVSAPAAALVALASTAFPASIVLNRKRVRRSNGSVRG